MNIEEEIETIKVRNARVEMDKAWETSRMRAFLILVLTYVIATTTLIVIGNEKPFFDAAVPTLGFFLSIQSFPLIKKIWIRKFCKRF